MKDAYDHKRVTPGGRRAGAALCRLTEPAIAALIADGEPDERCKTCAFRLGTVPNGCVQTQADAMKCVMEGVPFYCHQDPTHKTPCHGWFAGRRALKGKTRIMPWAFSHEEPTNIIGAAVADAFGRLPK